MNSGDQTSRNDQNQKEITLGEAARRWLGPDAVGIVCAAGTPSVALSFLVEAVRAGQLEVRDCSHPEPVRWVATIEALRAFGATRHCMPAFLDEYR